MNTINENHHRIKQPRPDSGAQSRCSLHTYKRDARFERPLLRRCQEQPEVSQQYAGARCEEHHLFSDRSRRAGSGLPSLPALPAGNRARSRRLARHVEHGVARLSLIEHGALDEAVRRIRRTPRRRRAPVAALSSSISAPRRSRSRRQGACCSPKQLIHETHLPMTEVAFAAGFGSIRRFNKNVRQLFGRSPRELRRTTAPEFRLRLPASCPAAALSAALRLDATIAFLRQRAISGIEHVSGRALRPHAATRRPDGDGDSRAGGRQRVARHRAFPKTLGVARHHRAAAACIRSRRRSAGYRRASCQGSDAGAARKSAPELARTRRLGRLRIGDPCRAWPADYRGRGCAARGPDGGGLWPAVVITGEI